MAKKTECGESNQGATGGSTANAGQHDSRSMSKGQHQRAYLLPIAGKVWAPELGPSPAPQEVGEGKKSIQEAGSRPVPGQCDSAGILLGKLPSLAKRRKVVVHTQNALKLSERRAFRVIGQAQSTQRRQLILRDDEGSLTRRIVQLASCHGRYGYRRITAFLRWED